MEGVLEAHLAATTEEAIDEGRRDNISRVGREGRGYRRVATPTRDAIIKKLLQLNLAPRTPKAVYRWLEENTSLTRYDKREGGNRAGVTTGFNAERNISLPYIKDYFQRNKLKGGKKPERRKRSPTKDEVLRTVVYDKKILAGSDKIYEWLKANMPNRVKQPNQSFDPRKHISVRYIDDWMSRQEVFQRHRRFVRDKTVQRKVVKRPFALQMDLTDLKRRPGLKGRFSYRYLLVVVDQFSKYAWVEPLRTKDKKAVIKALGKIFTRIRKKWKGKVRSIQSDNGSEFVNKDMTNFLRGKGSQRGRFYKWSSQKSKPVPDKAKQQAQPNSHGDVPQLFSTPYTPDSQGQVERFNRTLKRKLSLLRQATGEPNWMESLQAIVEAYNNTYQNTVKDTPHNVMQRYKEGGEVEPTLERLKASAHKGTQEPNRIAKKLYKKGDLVRIRLGALGRGMEKAADWNWSSEPYEITSVSSSPYGPGYRKTKYKLRGSTFNGKFPGHNQPVRDPVFWYNDQLIPYNDTTGSPGVEFRVINKILAPQIVKKDNKYYVAYEFNWMGYSGSEVRAAYALEEDVPGMIQEFNKKKKVSWKSGTRLLKETGVVKKKGYPSSLRYRWKPTGGGGFTEWQTAEG
jgi:transposase InsO family protein